MKYVWGARQRIFGETQLMFTWINIRGRPQRIAYGAQLELGDPGRKHGRQHQAEEHCGARSVEGMLHEAFHLRLEPIVSPRASLTICDPPPN